MTQDAPAAPVVDSGQLDRSPISSRAAGTSPPGKTSVPISFDREFHAGDSQRSATPTGQTRGVRMIATTAAGRDLNQVTRSMLCTVDSTMSCHGFTGRASTVVERIVNSSPASVDRLTAKSTDLGGRLRKMADQPISRPNSHKRQWTVFDGRPAVFKTV
jgi:hypothetical protein